MPLPTEEQERGAEAEKHSRHPFLLSVQQILFNFHARSFSADFLRRKFLDWVNSD